VENCALAQRSVAVSPVTTITPPATTPTSLAVVTTTPSPVVVNAPAIAAPIAAEAAAPPAASPAPTAVAGATQSKRPARTVAVWTYEGPVVSTDTWLAITGGDQRLLLGGALLLLGTGAAAVTVQLRLRRAYTRH
jgi:hypothetical protein